MTLSEIRAEISILRRRIEALTPLGGQEDTIQELQEQIRQLTLQEQQILTQASKDTAGDSSVRDNRVSSIDGRNVILGNDDLSITEGFRSTGQFSIGTDSEKISSKEKFALSTVENPTLPNVSDLIASPELDLGDRLGSDGSFIDDAGSVDSGDTPVYTGGSGQPPLTYYPSGNPLGAYAQYTYGLSLHVLSKDDYQQMMDSPGNFKPTKTIVASSSRYKETRLESFTDDFYFDNLQITTVIGLNSSTRGTNSVMVKFTLLEPYGLTLMDRILDISTNELGISNYLEIPYLLEINFFGYKDDGTPAKIEGQTKFIPIRIAQIGMRAKKTGSEYTFTAYAFNHMANLQSMQAVKANFEVNGRTVRDIFLNDLDAESKSEIEKAADIANKRAVLSKESTEREPGEQVDIRKAVDAGLTNTMSINSASPPSANVNSFTGAFNLFNYYEQTHGNIDFSDEIRFEIHPTIADATIVEPDYNSSGATPQLDTTVGAINSTNAGPDFTKARFSVNAGTSIIDFVNDVIITSSFITNQLKNNEKERKDKTGSISKPEDLFSEGASANEYVNWFKILPKVELIGFDKKRNKWAKRITFYVTPYAHYNTKDERAPVSQPPGSVKEYNFFYTGKNTDVIDFDIQFDTLYFTAVHVSKSLMESLNNAPLANPTTLTGALTQQPEGSIAPVMKEVTLGSHGGSINSAAQSSAKLNAMSFKDSIYSNAAGDMIELKLRIIGDPEFIKQDEIFYHPGVITTGGNQYVGDSGSLAMDDGEIFCTVNFKTPVDMDESTGLLRSDGRYTDSGFSGLYRIITVDNTFTRGQFAQTLTLIRQPNQSNDLRNNNKSTGESTARDTDSDTLTDNSKVPDDGNYVKFSNGSQVFVDVDTGTLYRTDESGELETEQIGTEEAARLAASMEQEKLRNTANDIREF